MVVAQVRAVEEGKSLVVRSENQRLLLAKSSGKFFALDDRCTHDEGPLGEGNVEGNTVRCPRHGACFDLATGAALCAPAYVGVMTYPVRVTGENVEVYFRD